MFMDGPGIRPALFEMGERLAAGGYYVLLPDMFWRAGPYEPIDVKVAFADPEARRATFGKMMATSQREQKLKFEIMVPVISLEKPTAICSFNWHQEHFTGTYGIRQKDGATAHTACLGFGLERITLALLRTHGLDLRQWPADVRERLAW